MPWKPSRSAQAEQKAKNEVQDRYHQLSRPPQGGPLPRHAVYRDRRSPTNLDLTRKAAEEALSVFAQRRPRMTGSWAICLRHSRAEQQAEVKEGCYELLMVLV